MVGIPLEYNLLWLMSVGNRAIELADEFPNTEVIGCDCVPLQPRYIVVVVKLPTC